MPVLKFEAKVIDGRPNITFGSDDRQIISKKRDYKDKTQKYSLRNSQPKDSTETTSKKIVVSHSNPQILKNTGKTNVANSYCNDIVHIVKGGNKSSGFKTEKESLFNFLDKTDKPEKSIGRTNTTENKQMLLKNSETLTLNDNEIDEIMRQVVIENKNLLSEEQLIDILAKLYLEAKLSRKPTLSDVPKLSEKVVNEDNQGNRKQTNEIHSAENNSSQMTSHIKEASSVPLIPSLTNMQKKQLQWEKERREMAELVSYNPWGKPGCGAPTKNSPDSFKYESTIAFQEPSQIQHSSTNKTKSNALTENLSQSELKRQQWLAELNEQVLDNERRRTMDLEQKRHKNQMDNSELKKSLLLDSSGLNHGRGKGLANLSQISTEEMIHKRSKQLEQQEAIRKQIEEKEVQKRLEREQKAYMDHEDEIRLLREKQQIDAQFISETARMKLKDDESDKKLAFHRSQLEAAERAALLDKKFKRLQRLDMAGHDTRQLRAGLIAEQMSGRLRDSFELKSEDESFNKSHFEKYDNQQVTRSPRLFIPIPITEDQAVQTDSEYSKLHKMANVEYEDDSRFRNQNINSLILEKHNRSAGNISNRKLLKNSTNRKRSSSAGSVKHNLSRKKPEPVKDRKPWGMRKVSREYIPQSKRDPFYTTSQGIRENHKQKRISNILAQVKANLDRIPDKDVHDGRSTHRHKKCETHKGLDSDKENCCVNKDTYELKNNNNIILNEENRDYGSGYYKDTYRQTDRQTDQPKNQTDRRHIAKSPEGANDWWYDNNHEIIRTTDVLNPAFADQRLPITRENTGREKARQEYYKNLNPAQYGESSKFENNFHYNNQQLNKNQTFYQPQGHPTQRQNAILKQLSDIREGLLMKQKEIETSLSFSGDM